MRTLDNTGKLILDMGAWGHGFSSSIVRQIGNETFNVNFLEAITGTRGTKGSTHTEVRNLPIRYVAGLKDNAQQLINYNAKYTIIYI